MSSNKSELILLERTLSNFPLISIGTGLALETLIKPDEGYFDDSRSIDYKVKKFEFRNIYINIYTILRNIVSAISTTEDRHTFLKDKAKAMEAIVTTFMEEYGEIERLLLANDFLPILYIVDYSKNKELKSNDRFILKIENETLMSEQNRFIELAVGIIKKEYYSFFLKSISVNIKTAEKNASESFINSFIEKLKSYSNKLLPVGNSNSLILTHFAIDLLNKKYVNNLSLLESHTGRIVKSSGFSKKFPELTNTSFHLSIPFVEKMYYIFGDGNLLKPINAKWRKDLYTILTINKVNLTTGQATIDGIINKNKSDLDSDFIDYYKNISLSY